MTQKSSKIASLGAPLSLCLVFSNIGKHSSIGLELLSVGKTRAPMDANRRDLDQILPAANSV